MFLERYEVAISSNHTVYKFVSQGAKGNIDKVVRYDETNLKDFYNLGFGDLSPETGEVDDIVVTDNGDGQKYWQQSLLRYTHSLSATPIVGFLQKEVPPQGLGFIEWE